MPNSNFKNLTKEQKYFLKLFKIIDILNDFNLSIRELRIIHLIYMICVNELTPVIILSSLIIFLVLKKIN
jgi:hypothetical protein